MKVCYCVTNDDWYVIDIKMIIEGIYKIRQLLNKGIKVQQFFIVIENQDNLNFKVEGKKFVLLQY